MLVESGFVFGQDEFYLFYKVGKFVESAVSTGFIDTQLSVTLHPRGIYPGNIAKFVLDLLIFWIVC